MISSFSILVARNESKQNFCFDGTDEVVSENSKRFKVNKQVAQKGG